MGTNEKGIEEAEKDRNSLIILLREDSRLRGILICYWLALAAIGACVTCSKMKDSTHLNNQKKEPQKVTFPAKISGQSALPPLPSNKSNGR